MSFEGDKARLVKELADAQAQVKAQYGLAERKNQLKDGKPVKPGTGPRSN
ncbi:hypothetical protein [Aeromicrobium stalagmiti]|nr:hypothetical protein [Aeromicrobium stalagmiti]NRQ49138.1 hypothetical protein [Aeromicrobium stalagmiti]